MTAERFEDLDVWKESKNLYIDLYLKFKDLKFYFFKDQILRATLSISNNIAEGFERNGNKEFLYFLSIAKGSAGEVRNMLIIANELTYLNSDEFKCFSERISYISKLIFNLSRYLKNNTSK